jgi:leucyl-tRNA synthetase
VRLEKEVQARWDAAKVFEVDADPKGEQPKFMVTFPYPYSECHWCDGRPSVTSATTFGLQ